MKRIVVISAIFLSAIVPTLMAQPRRAVDFQREQWLEVEVTFASAREFTDEPTLKHFILFKGKLLTGEVTHVNIPAGRENVPSCT